MLISRFELVEEPKPEPTTTSPPEQNSTLQSLFEQLEGVNGTTLQNDTTPAPQKVDIMSLVDLNKLTGEITFKKRIDYEELSNKTLSFQVQAIAGGIDERRTSLATVQLEIIDTNDNSPQFSQEVKLVV